MNLKDKKILITGGLGFIGFNAACYFAKNNRVCVVDDCSRIGVENNIELLDKFNIEFHHVDIARFRELKDVYFSFQPDVILHMAAQVAVTLSIENPYRDFRTNLQGSFNLLELARTASRKPIFLYASTNKVYGGSIDEFALKGGRYVSTRYPNGYSEESQLSFETPYGCSKGAADQYVIDYFKTYDIPSVVFRQSCIYGPHQYGMEDQGWVAWFAICSVFNNPLTIFGDGCQVRDVLYVDDLIELYEQSILNIDSVKGHAFNVGGGPAFTLSLNELVRMLEEKRGGSLDISYADWRLGDQKVYISDIRKVEALLGWKSKTSPVEGIKKLLEWIVSERARIRRVWEKQKNLKNQFGVSVVIPARNEEACLPAVLSEISLYLQSSSDNMEVIVVNDRSTDRTVEIAKQYPFVKAIDNKYGPGKGAALRSGFDAAKGTYIAMMDADFSHDIADLRYMFDEVKRHKGLVIGSRLIGGSEEYTRVRAFGNVILTWLFGFVHGRYLSDALNGFKVFHRDVYTQFQYTAQAYEIEIELLVNTLRLKRQISEVPSRERARMGGRVKSSIVRHGTLFMLRIFWEALRKPQERSPQVSTGETRETPPLAEVGQFAVQQKEMIR